MPDPNVHLTKAEAKILFDVISLVQNDPDWQETASATDAEWDALDRAASKILAVAR
jgi:hypothetical protein